MIARFDVLRRALLGALAALVCAAAAWAIDPDEQLDDPALEARARALSKTLRCVVCQSQSIDESASPLAKDLRQLVRERLLAGDTDAEARAYIVERYGDYVLLAPPVRGRTIFLWLGPLIFIGGGGAVFWTVLRRARASDGAGGGGDAAP